MERKCKNIFVEGAIAPDTIARAIQSHSAKTDIGAHSIFLGQVRADMKGSGWVEAIEYTAYTDMALKVAHDIREDVFARYPLVCMHVYHSIGRVSAGELCLFVFVSAHHREATTQACNEVVERIKSELPVWGNELISGGSAVWKENN